MIEVFLGGNVLKSASMTDVEVDCLLRNCFDKN